jgi:hypothetical protein
MILPRPWLGPAIGWGAVATTLFALFLSRRRSWLWTPRPRFAAVGAFVVVAVLLLSVPASWLRWDWQVENSLEGRDGRNFAVLVQPIWDKAHRAFAVESATSLTHTSYEILDPTPYEQHCPTVAWIVRPAGAHNDGPTLWTSDDGSVFAIDRGSCWAAWNGAAHRAATIPELVRMSPFVLLGDESEGREPDLQQIEWQFARTHGPDEYSLTELRAAAHPRDSEAAASNDVGPAVPTEAVLLAALDHANPWVRTASRRIVAAGGAYVYPEATRRVAAPPK